jgi:alkanesulfonate monooxygenase SsuD/methylene tetrahydromethanopterin reductase-like flavin-dependent oxidoreductase (luciferase family)
MPADFGFVLPAGPQKGAIRAWLDDLDAHLPHYQARFKSLWMTDHFFWDDHPTHEAWTVLAFAAARWPQFTVGPMVLGQSYRNPAMTAKMAATLHTLCNGRLVMALGAGWKEDEYHAYGYPFPSPRTRVEQLEDTLEIVTRLWKQPGPITYHGKHYQVDNAWCEPRPDPSPTLVVGGGGSYTMRLAARFADWWNVPDTPLDTYRDLVSKVQDSCRTVGRDPGSLRLTWFGRLAVGPTEAEAEALSGGKWTCHNALCGTPTQIIKQVQQFVDLGVSYFMVEILNYGDPEIRRMVLDDTLTAVQRG